MEQRTEELKQESDLGIRSKLPLNERAGALGLIAVLGLLAGVCWWFGDPKLSPERSLPLSSPPLFLRVYVEGAVTKPGPIELPKGASMSDLLEQVTLLDCADREAIRGIKKLKDREVISIPYVRN